MIVIGSIVIREDCLPQALALSLAHVARARTEFGCISHGVHQDSENPMRLVFVEEWSDRAALEQHFKVPASRAFVKQMTGLAIESPKLVIYDAAPIAP